MEHLNNQSSKITRLHTDSTPLEQPENTTSFALNAVTSTAKGDINNYPSEPSNELVAQVRSNYRIIGRVYLEDNATLIFSTDNTTSEIGLFSNDTYTELVNANLGFNTKFPITGEYRVRKGCNRTVYFRDSLNPDRFIDIDDLEFFQNEDGTWNINSFNIAQNFTIPVISFGNVNNSGGSLQVGTYRAQVEYLDDNLNVLYRSNFTNAVPIYNDNTTSLYTTINGDLNLEQYDSSVGGVPNTNKSITWNISNIDPTISLIRINIAKYTSGDGQTITASVTNPISINSSNISYTYTGLNDSIEDFDKLNQPLFYYDNSKVMEQIQNRLVRFNVQNTQRDYSGFQEAANNVNVTWTSEQLVAREFTERNSKNPASYSNGTTFMGDEIVALGISYIFDNGEESPVFNIAGRSPDDFDLTPLTVVLANPGFNEVSIFDVQHLGVTAGDTIPRWRVFNTARADGRLGYYEGTTIYPDIEECDGTPVFGNLVGQNIRHHRIPDRKLVPLYERNLLRNFLTYIGLSFDNITYPSSNIVGHKIYMAEANENEFTVIDTGYIYGRATAIAPYFSFTGIDYPDVNNNIVFGHTINIVDATNDFADNLAIISPKILANQYERPDYISVNNGLEENNVVFNPATSYDIPGNNTEILINSSEYSYNTNTIYTYDVNYINIEDAIQVGSRNVENGFEATPIFNNSYSNIFQVAKVNEPRFALQGNEQVYVTIKRNIRPFENIFNLRYIPITDILTLSDTTETYQGGSFINEFIVANIDGSGSLDDSIITIGGKVINNLWVESRINYDLRVAGNDCNIVYNSTINFNDHLITKVATFDEIWIPRSAICNEFYNYNRDYNNYFSTYRNFSLPLTYNYCSQCLNRKPYRIIFSPKSFDEEISDYYRVVGIDDYIDLPSHRGEIIGAKYKNNKLYVRTTQTMFILQPNPQFIATDQNSAYLNTGDFLSIPPYELQQTDLGFGGGNSLLGENNNDFGYFWVDSFRKNIYKLGSDFENISLKDISQWLEENIPSKFNALYKSLTGTNYEYLDAYTDSLGLGYMLEYDPRFYRLLICKKDRLPKNFGGLIKGISEAQSGILYFLNNNFIVKDRNNIVQTITIDNDTYFKDAGWILSYDLRRGTFTSFHSYLNDFIFSDSDHFYTVKDNKIYKHLHKDKFLNYFGTSYPFIIEVVKTGYQTDKLSSIQYHANFTDRNDNYDQLWIYNTNENSGLLNLTYIDQDINPYGNIYLSNDTKSIIEKDYNYFISNLYNNATQADNITTDVEYGIYGYIDKLPVNIDFNSSSYDKGYFRDKWVKVRLIYYNDKEENQVVHILNNIQTLKQ
jgi:hypothetical protein